MYSETFSFYLNRLLLRGLIVKDDGMTWVDALYRLLGTLQAIVLVIISIFILSSDKYSEYIN